MSANSNGEDLEEKKLLGSGGYAFAKLIELPILTLLMADLWI
jgi:hypothetical protein